ncbi:hypothetical protein FLA_3005 [Filimonas lacunae]|nr:hypothetical protein FLA_3005 [Filimonas lacunae]
MWSENEHGVFYKWPLLNIGVQLQPVVALKDALKEFESLLIEKESSGRVLARIIDQGAKAGIAISLNVEDMDAALEELSEKHRLKTSVISLEGKGAIRSGKVPKAAYSKSSLRRLFGLS